MRRLLCLVIFVVGCGRAAPARNDESRPADAAAVVSIVHPERKTIKHPVEQPGFNIEAYQETPLYSRITGYVLKWNHDIGETVPENAVLAELYVPEMKVDVDLKAASVRQAEAQIKQAQAAVLTAQAQLDRSKSQFERFTKVGQSGVLDKET